MTGNSGITRIGAFIDHSDKGVVKRVLTKSASIMMQNTSDESLDDNLLFSHNGIWTIYRSLPDEVLDSMIQESPTERLFLELNLQLLTVGIIAAIVMGFLLMYPSILDDSMMSVNLPTSSPMIAQVLTGISTSLVKVNWIGKSMWTTLPSSWLENCD